MWKQLGIAAVLVVTLIGCGSFGGFNVIRGSGNVISQTRDVSGFTAVELSGLGELSITQRDTESLNISAEDNVMPYIKTTVSNGLLSIDIQKDPNGGTILPTKPVLFDLHVKTLNSIALSGAGNAKASAVKSDALKLDTSGAGSINLAQLATQSVDTTTSGAGAVTLAGQTKTQSVSMSGIGTYNAGDLQSDDASVTVSGAGSATVWAAQTLKVEISGTGSVSYYGSPQVTQSISGIGSVKSLGSK